MIISAAKKEVDCTVVVDDERAICHHKTVMWKERLAMTSHVANSSINGF